MLDHHDIISFSFHDHHLILNLLSTIVKKKKKKKKNEKANVQYGTKIVTNWFVIIHINSSNKVIYVI